MAHRYVTVRVVGSDGRPVRDARVSLQIFQFMAGGFTKDQRTDSEGQTTIEVDADGGAECVVFVNGSEVARRGSIQGLYTVYI